MSDNTKGPLHLIEDDLSLDGFIHDGIAAFAGFLQKQLRFTEFAEEELRGDPDDLP